MMWFWLSVAVMLGIALAFVITPLLVGRAEPKHSREELNVEIYRERLDELKRDHEARRIDSDQYAASRRELEHELLTDVDDAGSKRSFKSSHGRWRSVVVVSLLVPLVAGLGYWQLGAYDRLVSVPMAQANESPSVEEMVIRLKERLKERPEDSEGWRFLGRSYVVLERFAEAAEAYQRVYELDGERPETLTDLAEALSLKNGTSMVGRPQTLIDKVLEMEPEYPKALWLAGVGAFQGGEWQRSIDLWNRLIGQLEPGSEDAGLVNRAIVDARRQLGVSTDTGGESTAGITVRLEIARELKERVNPQDDVFLYASPEEELGPPAAVARFRVSDLPVTIVLDDDKAVIPTRKLSQYQRVSVGARISRSGTASQRKGDLSATATSVEVGKQELVQLLIDHEV